MIAQWVATYQKNEDSEQTTKTGQLSSNLTKRERMIEAYQKQA